MSRTIPDTISPELMELVKNPLNFAKTHRSYPIPFQVLKQLFYQGIEITIKQPFCITLNDNFRNTAIVGDLHGDLASLSKIVDLFLKNRVDSLIFLGDYIDRGMEPLLTLAVILQLLCLWPDRVCILLGNHELRYLNRIDTHDFDKRIRHRYFKAEDFGRLKGISSQLFASLSVAAITPTGSLCLHGGVSSSLEKIQDINGLKKTLNAFNLSSDGEVPLKLKSALVELVWNDPVESLTTDFGVSSRGPNYKTFSEGVTERFLKASQTHRMIRSHESERGSFQRLFGGHLLHIFSSEPYFGFIPIAHILYERKGLPTQQMRLDGHVDAEFD